jgi:hypothetical protein
MACERSATWSLAKMFETLFGNRLHAHREAFSDHAIVQPLGDQIEDLSLPIGQLRKRRRPV